MKVLKSSRNSDTMHLREQRKILINSILLMLVFQVFKGLQNIYTELFFIQQLVK